jgi:hypothetical protein
MREYISVVEAAKNWNISRRRVALLCKTGRVPGASKVGNYWIIPADAKKPSDPRRKNGNNADKPPNEG